MNTTSAISICSNALVLLGHSSISSFDEEGTGAEVANNFYESVYKAKLAEYPWNFATKQIVLSRLTKVPLNRWKYMYQLPTDHIRILTTYPHSNYEILEDKIYSDNDCLELDYIYRVDESFLTPLFRESLELYLAAKWAIPVTENATNAGIYLDMHLKTLKKAKAVDSLEKPNKSIRAIATIPQSLRTRSRGW